MNLLEEIQNAAIDADSDLGTILRKCKFLAARLGSQPLEDWVLWESNGYPDDVDVPDYRIWPLELKGHFSGPFGSGIQNAPIPNACLPEKVRDNFRNYKCRQSVASIEETLRVHTEGSLYVPTGDLSLVLGSKVYQHQNCIKAWAEFGVGNLIELANAVRNKILDFSLAIWKVAPNAGESGVEDQKNIKGQQVTQIFNTTVYGGAANIVGAANSSNVSFNIQPGDIDSLTRLLRESEIAEPDICHLTEALNEDPEPNQEVGFGPKVSSWISKMMGKAADGTWNIGLGAAGSLLANAISKYYGFG